MQAANRLGLAFLLMIVVFLVLVTMAAAGLWAAGQPVMAVLVGVTGIAGSVAGAVTWRVVRADDLAAAAHGPPSAGKPAPRRIVHKPVRVQAMPVADLPPAYVDAVTKGAQARLTALKAQSREL
jgi:hypothetical protein